MKNSYGIPGVSTKKTDFEKDIDAAPKWLRDIVNYGDHPVYVRAEHHAGAVRMGRECVEDQLAQTEKIATRETYGRDHPCYTRKIDKGYDPLIKRRG